MGMQVVNGAPIACSFGAAPAALVVLPLHRTLCESQPAANILDSKPMLNIPSFGMCSSPVNPVVIAATAAALGVPTPGPCIPATVAPWVLGAPTVILDGMPTLDNAAKCMCSWGGVISITMPGQLTVMVP